PCAWSCCHRQPTTWWSRVLRCDVWTVPDHRGAPKNCQGFRQGLRCCLVLLWLWPPLPCVFGVQSLKTGLLRGFLAQLRPFRNAFRDRTDGRPKLGGLEKEGGVEV